jgi:hypothetical protein
LASLEAKDIIRDKSPDGKFALRIRKGEGWEAASIEVRTKKTVVDLETYGSYTKEARLVWSKDSKRVAHFGPDRRGGTTTVYFRNGSDFKEIPLPQIPDCDAPAKQDGDEYLKTIEYSAEPERWLKSGALLLAVHEEWTRNGGDFPEGSETVTIAFNAEHKVLIQLGISAGVLKTN